MLAGYGSGSRLDPGQGDALVGCRSRQVHRGGCTGPLQAPGSQRLALGQRGIVTLFPLADAKQCHAMKADIQMKSHRSVNCNEINLWSCRMFSWRKSKNAMWRIALQYPATTFGLPPVGLCQGGGHEPAVEDVLGKVLILCWFVTCPEQSIEGAAWKNDIKVHLKKHSQGISSQWIKHTFTTYVSGCYRNTVKYHAKARCVQASFNADTPVPCLPWQEVNYSSDVLLDNFWFFIFWFVCVFPALGKASLSDLKFSLCNMNMTWRVILITNWFVWFLLRAVRSSGQFANESMGNLASNSLYTAIFATVNPQYDSHEEPHRQQP